ncbi:hypothetical protein [Herbiconiux ginsengi]|uniref:Uncharacterized protein n=1 Tax=Herbiconiux ginsengi TaxID=381665 RepID=A0A1H3S437_9MICO|nr:hypothetical protein [Herbiconiux ginsengi]SDZ32786.1 hypothetical protein SAMN05216554_3297 [Herbiconiux ginsengi]
MLARYSSEEIRRAWAELIAVHISVGSPRFEFFRNAIATGGWSDDGTNDPVYWDDWITALFEGRGIRWADRKPDGERRLGMQRVILATGEVSEVEVREGLDTEWVSDPHSTVGGLTEVQGLRALELLLDVEWAEGRTDLVELRERLLRGVLR